MSLFDRLNKVAKTNKYAAVLSESKFMENNYLAVTDIPMLNVALSGEIDGGLKSGILQIVGDSRTFKTCYALIMMSAYLSQNKDSVALFFDSEKGASLQYFDTFGIDKSRVLHLPIMSVEDLKIQCVQQLEEIERGDKVFIFIDSVGLLPSRKEVEDAKDGKDVTDMTRAKALNSFWRSVTIPVGLKELPLVAINHYYDTMEMFSQKIIKGGKGGVLASNDIWIVSRSKLKEGTELAGWSFNIQINKSRCVKENAKIPVEVYYNGGVDKHSGLLEVARATGHITSEKKGWYSRSMVENDKGWRKSEMDEAFWSVVLEDESFKKAVKDLYSLSSEGEFKDIIEDFDPETGEIM